MKDWHREFAFTVLIICIIGAFIIGNSLVAGYAKKEQITEFCPKYTVESNLGTFAVSKFFCEGKEFKCSIMDKFCWYLK